MKRKELRCVLAFAFFWTHLVYIYKCNEYVRTRTREKMKTGARKREYWKQEQRTRTSIINDDDIHKYY